jgi:hypothetical protein
MFEKLANFLLFQSWRRAPQAYAAVPANDNLPIAPPRSRRPQGLICHWSLDEGGTRLICRWQMQPLTRTTCEDAHVRRAKLGAARKRSNRAIDTTRMLTVRT